MLTTLPEDFRNDLLQYLPEAWLDRYSNFLEEENFGLFHANLITMMIKGQPKERLPHYNEEIHIDLKELLTQFRKLYATQQTVEGFTREYARLLTELPFIQLLAVMGQRFTESSATDATALPPKKEILIKSCLLPYNTEITQARRAWEKHLGRGHTDFWGAMEGNTAKKEKQVRKLVEHVIEHATWWNVFFHYKHGLVYEIRIPNGNGIRWNREGSELIGFLEPFVEE